MADTVDDHRKPVSAPVTSLEVPRRRNRTRTKRGEKRPPAEARKGQDHGSSSARNQAQSLEPVAPLKVSANRWSRQAIAAIMKSGSPEMVERRVTGLLNKLTMTKFESISDQIVGWANKSEKEKDGRTLIQVTRLVFEKAIDEPMWSEMYARLCRNMMEQISPKVYDEGIKNAEGKPIAGGQLFLKYLLNRCHEDFERGWAAKDSAVKTSNGKKEKKKIELYSDEYYAAAKAKRQGLGLVKFIGELFKLQMVTERIMHECVQRFLGDVENPEEVEIESLCKILTTVGQVLDTPKAQEHMDIYFSRMEKLTKSNSLSLRMQFMLMDVIELRARKWVPRHVIEVPTSHTQLNQSPLRKKATRGGRKKLELQSRNYASSNSHPSSDRARGRNDSGPGGMPPDSKAGDLSHFGKIIKGQPISFGPSSVFAENTEAEKRKSTSGDTSSSSVMLQDDTASEPKSELELALLVLGISKQAAASAAASRCGGSGRQASRAADAEPGAPNSQPTTTTTTTADDSRQHSEIQQIEVGMQSQPNAVRTVFSDPLNGNVKTRLFSTWTAWFDSPATKGRDLPHAPMSDFFVPPIQALGGTDVPGWMSDTKRVTGFDSHEDFWKLYNHICPPTQFPQKANYYLFKEGIIPAREDEANKQGGKWSIQLPKNKNRANIDKMWLNTMLAAIGETFDPSPISNPTQSLITGVIMSVRPQFYRLSIWTRTAPKEEDNELRERIISVGKHFKTQVLGYAEGACLKGPLATEVQFESHEDAEKKLKGKLRKQIIV